MGIPSSNVVRRLSNWCHGCYPSSLRLSNSSCRHHSAEIDWNGPQYNIYTYTYIYIWTYMSIFTCFTYYNYLFTRMHGLLDLILSPRPDTVSSRGRPQAIYQRPPPALHPPCADLEPEKCIMWWCWAREDRGAYRCLYGCRRFRDLIGMVCYMET